MFDNVHAARHLLLIVTGLTGCTRPNPDFCCDSEVDCRQVGELRPCEVGVCVNNSCATSGCDGDEDCLDPNAAHCVTGQCVGDAELCVSVGGRIAFVSDRDGDEDIYVSYADGSFPGLLTLNDASEASPSWSVDGAKISFRSDVTGPTDVFVVNADGLGIQNVSNSPDTETTIAWSPDSATLAFDAIRSGQLHVVTTTGSQIAVVTTSDPENGDPTWSPDGLKLVFRSGSTAMSKFNLHVSTDRGVSSTQLTPIVNAGQIDSSPRWSPDGLKIALLSTRNGNPDVWVVDPDGMNLTNLTASATPELDFAWSPDSSKIAFVREIGGDRDVWIMNADGSAAINLTLRPGADEHPRWSPDGASLVFASHRDGNTELYRMGSDGSNATNITNEMSEDADPEWTGCNGL